MSVYRIYGGKVVTPERVIENGTVTIEDGLIAEVSPAAPSWLGAADISAEGQWVIPGLIDSHSDAIEVEIQPRVRTLFPVDLALRELERKLAGQGITTMYHALGLAEGKSKQGVRTPEMIRSIVSAIRRISEEAALIRHRIHVRFEITNLPMVGIVEDMLREREIHQLSFTDHSPGQGQYRSLELYRSNAMQKGNLTEEEAESFVRAQMGKKKVEASKLGEMANLAHGSGIPIASHDDDSIDKLDWVAGLNANISEFPIELEVAREARRRGMYVVMGAPNVLLGRSSSGNLSALEAISQGCVDMLCSDYYPSSLLHAVFKLHRMGYDMPYAVNLATLNPAKALGMHARIGSLEAGKAADLLLVHERQGIPAITHTMIEGSACCKMEYRKRQIG